MSEVSANDVEMSSTPSAETEEVEPTEVEHDKTADIAVPEPGSVPLVSEHGNPKFPRALLDRGGYDILRMPLNKGLPVWVTSAGVLKLDISIEAVLLNLTEHALLGKDANLHDMLRMYDWYPSGLLDVPQSKRKLRWDWIMSKDPVDPVLPGDLPPLQHCFWAKGFGISKAKDDKLVEADQFKQLNYKSFRQIMREVCNTCITTTPNPVEIMGLIRRHWNELKEPSLDSLRSKVKMKKKHIRSKNQAAKKKADRSSSGPSTTSEAPVGSQDQAGDPSPATDQNLTGEQEVVMLAEVRHTNGQSTAPVLAPLPPGVPIVRTPLVNFQATPPVIGRQPGVVQPRGILPVPPRYGSGLHGQGRQRGGSYRGRKAVRSNFRGPRAGYSNSRPPMVAPNSQSRGNGRTGRGGYGFGPGISWVNCWACGTANPSLNQVCSHCHNCQF